MGRDYLPELDGLRALACMAVLINHLTSPGWLGHIPVASNRLAMAAFFCLSGFLITRILLADAARQPTLRAKWAAGKQFWFRRAARIFPAYYLLVAVLLVVYGWNDSIGYAAVYLTNYMHLGVAPDPLALGHLWSLAAEEHFYLLWPLVVVFLPRAGAQAVGVALIVASVTWAAQATMHAAMTGGSAQAVLARSTHTCMAAMVAGSLVAYSEADLRRSPWRLAVVAGAVFLVAHFVPHVMAPRVSNIGDWRHFIVWAQATLRALAALLIVLAVAHPEGWCPLKATFADPRLTYMGRISYGLYLYHLPIYYWMGVRLNTDMPVAGQYGPTLALVLTFAVAWASHRYFEEPIRRWARGRSTKPAAMPVPAVAVAG